jgi:hypothetical protein
MINMDERWTNPYVSSRNSMLTRAFLLLLAMMTGLTASQAAERIRPEQGASALSAMLAKPSASASVRAETRQAIFRAAVCAKVCAFASVIDRVDQPYYSAPIAPRTYLADRSRR